MESVKVSARLLAKATKQQEIVGIQPVASSSTEVVLEEDGLSKAARNQKRYRQRMKEKPDLYKHFKAAEAERHKTYRQNLTDDLKTYQKEQARLRQQKHRDKKKEAGQSVQLQAKTPKTRAALTEKREKDRIRQEKYRASLSAQKKTSIRARRRESEKMKNALVAELPSASRSHTHPEMASSLIAELPSTSETHPEVASSPVSIAMMGYNTGSAQRKAVQKAKRHMPDSPRKYVAVLASLQNTKSPRKKTAMRNAGLMSPKSRKQLELRDEVYKNILTDVRGLQKSRSKRARQKKTSHICSLIKHIKQKRGLSFHLRRELNVSWKYITKCSQLQDDGCTNKTRKDALSQDVTEKVHAFYTRGDISKTDPTTKTVSKKTLQPTRYMEMSLGHAHKQFLEENPDIKNVSISKFSSMRPAATKVMKCTRLNTCCCEYCSNVDLKLRCINHFCAKTHMPRLGLGHKYEVSNLTLCGRDENGQNKRDCLDRLCPECGTSAVRQQLEPLLSSHGDSLVNWKSWQSRSSTYINKDGKEMTVKKKMLVTTAGPFDQVVEELTEELEKFSLHLFNARWQQQQFHHITSHVPDGGLVMVMDFAENFSCFFQDEAQSAHWAKNQVTIHPIVTYFRCPDDGAVCKDSFIIISDDLKHDSHAVHHFSCKVVNILQERGLSFTKVVQFTDGCAAQYKGRTGFVDISFAVEDTGIVTERHFFGSRHGKSVCDGEIGVVKRCASLAVKAGGIVIADAKDLYEYCSRHLTLPLGNDHLHSKRTILFVKMGTIPRDRPDRVNDRLKGIPGSQKLHCVRAVMPNVVSSRDRTCFCNVCLETTLDEPCRNISLCGEWKPHNLLKDARRPRAGQRNEQGKFMVIGMNYWHNAAFVMFYIFVINFSF